MIEDEADLAEMVGYNLRREGFEFHSFSRGKDGLQFLRNHAVDLLLLDIMLPRQQWFRYLPACDIGGAHQERSHRVRTAKGEEYDRVLGLELGGDDYVVKPFSPRELIARIRAVFRQSRAPGPGRSSPYAACAWMRQPTTSASTAGSLC